MANNFIPEDIIIQSFLKNQEAFFEIQREVQNNPYANISLTLRVHEGGITDVIFQTFRRKRFTDPQKKVDPFEKK